MQNWESKKKKKKRWPLFSQILGGSEKDKHLFFRPKNKIVYTRIICPNWSTILKM